MYSKLRQAKIHTYTEKEIQAAAPLHSEYLKFWNVKCLDLFENGHAKTQLEPSFKKLRNTTGRYISYIKFGKEVSNKYDLDQKWDIKYKEQYEQVTKQYEKTICYIHQEMA